jgi:LysM repeat protein
MVSRSGLKGEQSMKNRLVVVGVVVVLLLAGFSFPRAAQAGSAYCHVVKAGETLAQIAWRYGVSVDALAAANNLWNPNLIYVGQCLVIPGGGAPDYGCSITHVVKRGEYLKLIAARYGVSWQTLAQVNGLSNANLIYPGQHLKIPVKCQPTPKPKPTPKPSPTPEPPPKAWKGQYWDNRYLSGDPKKVKAVSAVDFAWGFGGPGHGVGNDNFSARWTRTKDLDAGKYRFHVRVDDGVRLWLDGVLLIDEWHDSAAVEYTAETVVSAGSHQIQIDYYEHLAGAQIKFWMERWDGTGAWKGEYFDNTTLAGTPVTTQYYNAINFDWGNQAPAPGVTADYFSVRWTGDFAFAAGTYRFSATMDDGIRVFVDGELILDQWTGGPPRTFYAEVDLSEGTHQVKVEHFEYKGIAVAKVSWTKK